MTKTRIVIKAGVIGMMVTVIAVLVGAMWLFNFSWTKISSNNEMEENGTMVLQSVSFPDAFYQVYDKVKPDQRERNMLEQVRVDVFGNRNVKHWDCKCDEVGYLMWNNKTLNLKANRDLLLEKGGYLKFGIGLEKYANPQKCFDFWLNNSIFWKGNYLKDLNTLSTTVINKDLDKLNTNEILLLIAWHDMLDRGIDDSLSIQKRYEILKREYQRVKP